MPCRNSRCTPILICIERGVLYLGAKKPSGIPAPAPSQLLPPIKFGLGAFRSRGLPASTCCQKASTPGIACPTVLVQTLGSIVIKPALVGTGNAVPALQAGLT